MNLGIRARLFIGFVCTAGLLSLAWGLSHWQAKEPLVFTAYIFLVAVASALKVVLPGFESTVSVSFVFFLMSIHTLSLSETLLLGVTAVVVQCYWKRSAHLRFIHVLFNLSQISAAILATYYVDRSLMGGELPGRMPLALLASCAVYFICNTAPVAAVVAFAEQKPFLKKWQESYAWTSASYLIGAAIAGIVLIIDQRLGWQMSVLVMPAIYALYRTYSVHTGKLESHARHLQEMADLHLRTVEALALAIEAKDHTTGDHLQRVQYYAIELGKDLGLTPGEIDALRAASVLHDIGKLAVPEHIIGKPGKLTPEEFERMKVHPIVGAEILEQVRFPYAVVPIVRSHHEKWDGSGYPDGLKGEQIPIGARILAAVDCLDALASDRQYRRALPLDQAMQRVEQEAGKSFDPRVVAALKARYVELERLVKSLAPQERPKLSVDVKVSRGGAPAAGYADARPEPRSVRVLASGGAEAIGVRDELAMIAMRLRESLPYDALAVYLQSGSLLHPEFTIGVQAQDLDRLSITKGTGLVGWIAELGEPILNGNPQVELGFPDCDNGLCCALATPFSAGQNIRGVVAAYSCEEGAFTSADLAILQAASAAIATVLDKRSARGQDECVSPNLAVWHKVQALMQ